MDELTKAYIGLFTTAFGPVVLRDLMNECGFMASLPPGSDPLILTDHNARRSVFGRIYEILNQHPSGRDALALASRGAETSTEETL